MQIEADKNLIVVSTVEGYAQKYNMTTEEVLQLFHKVSLLTLLRAQYEVLHTQNLDESVSFAEDVLARRNR